MTEEQRQRAIRQRLVRSEDRRLPALPSGFATLDAALGGGFERGTIVELFGASSTGKTTLALQIVANAQKSGSTAAWIDAEHVFDARYAAGLGVTVELMPLAQPETAEQALEIVSTLAQSSAVDLIVVDSAAALVPRLQLEAPIGDGGEGLQARVLASGLRRLSHVAARSGTVIIFLNQTRSRKQASGGQSEISAGGAPLKLHASLRVALEMRPPERVVFRILKNKGAAAFREGGFRRRVGGEFTETP